MTSLFPVSNTLKMEAYCDIEDESLRGQAEILKYAFSYIDSMAVKCAVELRIPDIINSHGGPITLAQIIAHVSSAPSPDTSWLDRIMRLLVRRNIFAAHRPSDGGEELFGLTRSSRWLLQDGAGPTLAPFLLLENHQSMTAPWHCMSECVGKGGTAFDRAHGKQIWDFAAENPEFNKVFNDGMECVAEIVLKAVLAGYEGGLGGLRSLVDVGGGTGRAISEIVKSHPQIEGINFDLPHVIATAPEYPGVSHVGGDMFESVPSADAVFIKWVLHNWTDEDCVKILKNCRKAIPKESGKVIIVDVIFEPRGDSLFDDAAVTLDLVMGTHTTGRERTKSEWDKVLKEGGFSRFKLIKTTTFQSIIEAYPD